MIGNVTAAQCMVLRLSQMQDEGKLLDHHASLAKAFCTVRMRETVAWARELFCCVWHSAGLPSGTFFR